MDFSTVIIVNKTHGQTRSIQVKTKHLKLYKHYIAIVTTVIICLCVTVFYLNRRAQIQEMEKQQLLSQITKLEREIPPPVVNVNTGNKAQTYIQGIEAKLQKINTYLTKRGLKISTTTRRDVGYFSPAIRNKIEDLYSSYTMLQSEIGID